MRAAAHSRSYERVMDRAGRVRDYLRQSAQVKLNVADGCVKAILTAADMIAGTFASGGKMLMCGNGGSAADCQHLATEFVSRLSKELERPGLPAIALTTDTSFLTAFSNDYEFDGVFARQVEALGKAGDLLLGISTSGNSANVLRALKAATESGMRTVALTGQGGRAAAMADVAITVPSDNTQYVQESHLAIEHILCDLVERALFDSRAGAEVRKS